MGSSRCSQASRNPSRRTPFAGARGSGASLLEAIEGRALPRRGGGDAQPPQSGVERMHADGALVVLRLEGDREGHGCRRSVLNPVRRVGPHVNAGAGVQQVCGSCGSHSTLRCPPPSVCSSASCWVSESGNRPTFICLVPRTWSRKLCSGSVCAGVTEPGAERKMNPSRLVIPSSLPSTAAPRRGSRRATSCTRG